MSKALAGAVNDEGARIDVAQTDEHHVSVMIYQDGRVNVARVPAERACGLALAILLANGAALSRVAQHLSDEDGAELGMRLLEPSAARALARKAAAPEGALH